MSVATELTRIQNAKASLKTSIEAKGVTVSSDALIDAYPALVDAIPSGSPEEKDVNFYDYDGTLVASYTGVEAQALTALPDAPDHSTDTIPLTFDEWNWTLAEIKAYNTANPNIAIDVGANYHPTDNKIHLIYKIDNTDFGSVHFWSNTSKGTIDWGDGNTQSLASGTITHTYSQTGTYDCKIEVEVTATLAFGDSNVSPDNLNLIKCYLTSNIGISNNFLNNCQYLEEISLPSTISGTTLAYTFSNCKSLKCLIVPRSWYNPAAIQMFCYNVGSSVISYPGNSIKFHGTSKFQKSITIPSSVITIDSNLFNENTLIKKAIIPNTVTQLGGNTFMDCSFLQDVFLSSSLTQLNGQTFSGCSMLKKLTIPTGITVLSSSEFYNCVNLETIELSSGTTTLGQSVFYGCEKLKSITLPATVTSIGKNAFYNCKSLTSISIPYGVTAINDSTFNGCSALASVSIPETVTTIGANAFQSTVIASITLPSSLTSIGNAAFRYCANLTTITSLATAPPTLTSALPNTITKIYVPYSSDHSVLDAYKIASNWSNFASIMEELPE